jgi:hypothetical protein
MVIVWVFLNFNFTREVFLINSSPRGFRALKRGLTFNYITNNLKFTIMKLLMTVQPKNGEKPSDPMLIDTNESDLCCLADDFLRAGDKVLIFQPVTEYHAAPCGECDKKE